MHFYLVDNKNRNLDVRVTSTESGSYMLDQGHDCVVLSQSQIERLVQEYQYDQRRQSLKDRG
ncbi:hypothetical protein KNT81_gp225 [Proteus phage phiP4-3]|uniref:Uncharacterized protein n=1 Tax=Proteus phage phiP4-3 TaxID=2065203 RepID=A0A2I6PFQ9_9CAUD|nr:hypothetical protein KNT81_gp225 [Proteus phage phiP4-3]AUM58546.1 hypothetical protein phiP43_188 [Proteus phage phiP4-3]AZV01214.1 hypothetical protein vBSdyM006_077 [Shigella phage vB_SdyM_006]